MPLDLVNRFHLTDASTRASALLPWRRCVILPCPQSRRLIGCGQPLQNDLNKIIPFEFLTLTWIFTLEFLNDFAAHTPQLRFARRAGSEKSINLFLPHQERPILDFPPRLQFFRSFAAYCKEAL